MELLIVIALWITLSCVVAVTANHRGHSEIMYFFYSIVLSPVVVGAMVLMYPDLKQQALDEQRHQQLVELLSK